MVISVKLIPLLLFGWVFSVLFHSHCDAKPTENWSIHRLQSEYLDHQLIPFKKCSLRPSQRIGASASWGWSGINTPLSFDGSTVGEFQLACKTDDSKFFISISFSSEGLERMGPIFEASVGRTGLLVQGLEGKQVEDLEGKYKGLGVEFIPGIGFEYSLMGNPNGMGLAVGSLRIGLGFAATCDSLVLRLRERALTVWEKAGKTWRQEKLQIEDLGRFTFAAAK